MYDYHQNLCESNKRILVTLCSGDSSSVIIWGAVFLKQKISKALFYVILSFQTRSLNLYLL